MKTSLAKLTALGGLVCLALPLACDKNGDRSRQPQTTQPATTEPTAPENSEEGTMSPASRYIGPGTYQGDQQQQPMDDPDPMPAPESVPDEAPDVPFTGDAGIMEEGQPERSQP